MELRVLATGDEAAVEAFLRPRIASSMFLLGNMHAMGLADCGERYCGTYAGAFKGDVLVGVAAHYWNGVLIPQARDTVGGLWRLAVAQSGRPISGVVGPDAQAATIIADLEAEAAITGHALNVRMDKIEKLYRLDLEELVVPEALRRGTVRGRPAVVADLGVLTAWGAAFSTEALGDTPSPALEASSRAGAEVGIAEGTVWVLEVDGTPVAETAFNTRTADAVQVGGVYTPPELRGRGYARCAVAASLLGARDAGARLGVLFTGSDNLAAQRAYGALGFEHIGGWRLMLLRDPWAFGAAA